LKFTFLLSYVTIFTRYIGNSQNGVLSVVSRYIVNFRHSNTSGKELGEFDELTSS
jgi:hypothetical protein